MVLVRAFGWLLLALAVAALVYDGLTWVSSGAFRLVPLGELWGQLDPAALYALEKDPARGFFSSLGRWLLLPVLALPALPVFAVLGLLLLRLGQPRTREPKPVGFVLGARPPRRRRRGGGLS